MPTHRAAALALLILAGSLPGCDGDAGKAPPAAPPPAETKTPPATKPPASGVPAAPGDPRAEPLEVTVGHVLYSYKGASRSKVGRTKEQALALAKDAIVQVKKGRPLADLVWQSDDQGPSGANTNRGEPGTYTFMRGAMEPAFTEASFSTPVGQVAPEPVETPYGYHVIVRIK